MTSRRTKISPKSGRGLGHVTSTIFGSTVGYPSDSLASCLHVRCRRRVVVCHSSVAFRPSSSSCRRPSYRKSIFWRPVLCPAAFSRLQQISDFPAILHETRNFAARRHAQLWSI